MQECVELDSECLDARFGVVYTCGLLGLFAEAQNELERIAEMDKEDERLAEMRAKLAELQLNDEGDEDEDDEAEEPTEDAEAERTLENVSMKGIL